EHRTTVLYEAPHRLERTLADLVEHCGDDRRVAVARELTKVYEQVWRGTLSGALAWARETSPRGEIAIVVAGAPEAVVDAGTVPAAGAALLLEGASARDTADAVARRLGVRRRVAYDIALEQQRRNRDDD